MHGINLSLIYPRVLQNTSELRNLKKRSYKQYEIVPTSKSLSPKRKFFVLLQSQAIVLSTVISFPQHIHCNS